MLIITIVIQADLLTWFCPLNSNEKLSAENLEIIPLNLTKVTIISA